MDTCPFEVGQFLRKTKKHQLMEGTLYEANWKERMPTEHVMAILRQGGLVKNSWNQRSGFFSFFHSALSLIPKVKEIHPPQ